MTHSDVTTKEVRKVLDRKIIQLNDIVADLDSLLTRMETNFFRVSIFGSARIKPESEYYTLVYDLASRLAQQGVDIVTGGGPGIMAAANEGAKASGADDIRSIGLHIELPFETDTNNHLDVTHYHRRFSSRLDEFMRITHAVIVTPGGVGTLLEMFYTWQLIQVSHIASRPIILLGGGDMWPELLQWLDKWPSSLQLLNKKDLDMLKVCQTVDEALAHLAPDIAAFKTRKKD